MKTLEAIGEAHLLAAEGERAFAAALAAAAKRFAGRVLAVLAPGSSRPRPQR